MRFELSLSLSLSFLSRTGLVKTESDQLVVEQDQENTITWKESRIQQTMSELNDWVKKKRAYIYIPLGWCSLIAVISLKNEQQNPCFLSTWLKV